MSPLTPPPGHLVSGRHVQTLCPAPQHLTAKHKSPSGICMTRSEPSCYELLLYFPVIIRRSEEMLRESDASVQRVETKPHRKWAWTQVEQTQDCEEGDRCSCLLSYLHLVFFLIITLLPNNNHVFTASLFDPLRGRNRRQRVLT